MRLMKDSGIEWIGDIPRIWKVVPLRSQYLFGKGLSITKADLTDSGAAVISYGQIHSKDNIGVSVQDSLIRYISWDNVSLSDSSKTSIGDIIFADTSEDLEGCGNCVYVDRTLPNYAGYHTIILRPKTSDLGRYYAYLFASDAWRAQIRANVSGVKVFSVTQNVLKTTKILIPPVEEQKRIVSFLDKKCSEIDALIAAKEKTNSLLKELRQSIIYEAVTKGLDPTAPMKDSGVEWVGEIPEGWGIAALKRLGTPVTGSTPSKNNPDYWEGNIPWLSSKDMKTDYLLNSEDHITQKALDECGLTLFEPGTLIFCVRSGILRHTFPVAVATLPVTINQDLRALNLTENVNPAFLLYYMRGLNDTIVSLYQKIGATVESIEMNWFLYFPVALPPLDEQNHIVETLDSRCASLDQLVEQNETTILQLKEYRQSLIYEAVTGKIEV